MGSEVGWAELYQQIEFMLDFSKNVNIGMYTYALTDSFDGHYTHTQTHHTHIYVSIYSSIYIYTHISVYSSLYIVIHIYNSF